MAKKLLVEGYRPWGREVTAEGGSQQRGDKAPAAGPGRPPVPPKATSAVVKPKPEK
jgi:hypothetical protein